MELILSNKQQPTLLIYYASFIPFRAYMLILLNTADLHKHNPRQRSPVNHQNEPSCATSGVSGGTLIRLLLMLRGL